MDALLVDLAAHALGGRLLEASDETFSAAAHLVADDPPGPRRPGERRRDAWETRRRRGEPGHDWAIVRLGMRGILRRVVLDTGHTGTDRPESYSLEAIDLPGDPNIVELVRDPHRWAAVVARTAPVGEGPTRFEVPAGGPVTHVRLVIYPDGAVARLRCLGEPVPPAGMLGTGRAVDLAAVPSGARVVDCSDPGGSSPNRMLGAPGPPPDGWLTGRRRAPGHEWAVVRLAGAGTLERLVIDTTGFKGESPGAAAVHGILAPGADPESLRASRWHPVLPETPLQPGRSHEFGDLLAAGPFSHLRLDLHPDGGVARFSALGTAEAPWSR